MFHFSGPCARMLRVIADSGTWEEGWARWEHVSVSLCGRKNRTPTWGEMQFVKEQFWEDTETVMQLHPPRADYVNTHPGVLHLWRPLDLEIPRPENIMV